MNKNFQLKKLNVHRMIKFCSNVTDDTLLALKRFQIVATVVRVPNSGTEQVQCIQIFYCKQHLD